MKRGVWQMIVAGVGVVAVAGVVTAVRADGGMTEKEKAQKEPYPNDLGPDTIDMAKYPEAVKANAEYFKQCGQCHTIARPINSQMWSSEDWTRYVKRMMSKPGCEIKKGTGSKIRDFLVADSKARKLSDKPGWKKHRVDLLTQFKAKYPDRYKLLFEDRTPEQEATKELPGW